MLYIMLRDKLEFIRTRMKQYYDKYRLKGPRLERGDKVYLISRNLRTNRLSRKLDFKKIRPFKVDECQAPRAWNRYIGPRSIWEEDWAG